MKRINFDHLACSPILSEAKDAMIPFLSESIGNPLSWHIFGEDSGKAIETARENVASLINARAEEIIFTSCGSESNNLAIKGIAKAYSKKGKHIIASPIEHHSVLHPLQGLEREGCEVSWLTVDRNGMVKHGEVTDLIREDTVLVTVTSASNEIGTLEPIQKIGAIAKQSGIIFHTDAVACAGFIPLDVHLLNVDLLSLAGNTFYGPLGTGALFVRKGIRISPLISGGIQEKGLRAGTHNVAGIVGMGVAAKKAKENLMVRTEHLRNLRDQLIKGVLDQISDSFLTGHPEERLPGHASFCIRFIEGEAMLVHLNSFGIAGTSGSTCSSQALKVSHVLKALRIDPLWAQGSLVFTLGVENTGEDIEFFLSKFPSIVERLRKMSPLVAKYQKNSNSNKWKS
jgi:cysteine desulfurase